MTASAQRIPRDASLPFPLTVESVRGPLGTLVRVVGELDLYSTPKLTEELLRAVRTDRPVAVDLTEVDLIDSTALAALLQAGRKVHPAAGPLRIVCASFPIRKIFEITGADRYLRICASVDEAFGA